MTRPPKETFTIIPVAFLSPQTEGIGTFGRIRGSRCLPAVPRCVGKDMTPMDIARMRI